MPRRHNGWQIGLPLLLFSVPFGQARLQFRVIIGMRQHPLILRAQSRHVDLVSIANGRDGRVFPAQNLPCLFAKQGLLMAGCFSPSFTVRFCNGRLNGSGFKLFSIWLMRHRCR